MEPLYFAEQPCSPEVVVAGVTRGLQHLATLEPPDFSEAISWGSSNTGPISGTATVRADLSPQRGLQVIHYLEHHRLDSMTAELSLWTPGTGYNARAIQVAGSFLIDAIPVRSRPIQGTITQRVLDKALPLPPASAVTNLSTFPGLPVATGATDPSNDDVAYPLWIGANGNAILSATDYRTSCIKCIGVNYAARTLLVSYGPLTPTTCTIRSVVNYGSPYVAPLTHTTDSLGNVITVADITASGWVYATVDDFIADSWYVISIDGGQPAYDHAGPLLGLGEVIAWLLLQRYSAERVPALVDLSAWAAVRPVLDTIKVGVLIDGSADPWDAVVALMPLAPGLFIIAGPSGLRPVLITPRQYSPLTPLLVANRDDQFGPDLVRMAGQQSKWAGANIVNAITLSYVRRLSSGAFLASLTVGPDQSPLADASALRYGQREVIVEAPQIWSVASGFKVAANIVDTRSNQPTQDTWFAPMDVAIALPLGTEIRVRDDQAGYADLTMWVIAREAVHVGACTVGYSLTCLIF